jgi:hypothetical protein
MLEIKGKIGNECILIRKNKIRLKKPYEKKANQTLANDDKVNKLNKELLVLKEIMLR